MWDTLGWGGETQALVYNPHTKKVVAVNALGVAPTGATPEFYKSKGMAFPPEFGPLAAVTPGTPGGLIVMLAEWGKLSLGRRAAAPAIQMADGYPIEAAARERHRAPEGAHQGVAVLEGRLPAPPRRGARGARSRARSSASPTSPRPCASWWRRSSKALKAGKSRKEAIFAAYDRFYKGDIAQGAGARAPRSRAASSPRTTWPAGSGTSKSR